MLRWIPLRVLDTLYHDSVHWERLATKPVVHNVSIHSVLPNHIRGAATEGSEVGLLQRLLEPDRQLPVWPVYGAVLHQDTVSVPNWHYVRDHPSACSPIPGLLQGILLHQTLGKLCFHCQHVNWDNQGHVSLFDPHDDIDGRILQTIQRYARIGQWPFWQMGRSRKSIFQASIIDVQLKRRWQEPAYPWWRHGYEKWRVPRLPELLVHLHLLCVDPITGRVRFLILLLYRYGHTVVWEELSSHGDPYVQDESPVQRWVLWHYGHLLSANQL